MWVFQLVVVGEDLCSVVGALRDGGAHLHRLLAAQVRFPDWYEMDHAGLVFVLAWGAEVAVGEALAWWGSPWRRRFRGGNAVGVDPFRHD